MLVIIGSDKVSRTEGSRVQTTARWWVSRRLFSLNVERNSSSFSLIALGRLEICPSSNRRALPLPEESWHSRHPRPNVRGHIHRTTRLCCLFFPVDARRHMKVKWLGCQKYTYLCRQWRKDTAFHEPPKDMGSQTEHSQLPDPPASLPPRLTGLYHPLLPSRQHMRS